MAKLSFAMKLATTGMPFASITKILAMAKQTKTSEMGLFWATKVVPMIPKTGKRVWA